MDGEPGDAGWLLGREGEALGSEGDGMEGDGVDCAVSWVGIDGGDERESDDELGMDRRDEDSDEGLEGGELDDGGDELGGMGGGVRSFVSQPCKTKDRTTITMRWLIFITISGIAWV